MDINFKYELGDIVETRRGETGKIVLVSACQGRDSDYFKTYKLADDQGGHVWAPEFSITRVVGW